jgi:dimethylamine/trimethylamine dehydrogenase
LTDPDQKLKMTMMGAVEHHAAKAVRPILDKYSLTPRSQEALFALGRKASTTLVDWDTSLDEMRRTFPGYIDDFKRLEALAPPEDRQRLEFLTEHEHAAIAFLELEKTDKLQSAKPLIDYLATSPELRALDKRG